MRLTSTARLGGDMGARLRGGAPVRLRPPQGLIPAGHPPRSFLIMMALGGAFLGPKLGPVFLPARFSTVSIVSNCTLF